ncbi:SgcJ/EcaC family oxidoreductase [Synechococcus sp. LTW-R]|uniref:SgcJ/EcaC family oxidoreductase n=1 Tax=Synechococcus sp. LTW-R TaxID=2751170 RepID=UPI0021078CBB|nr:SgcJ/EcaC family oxidoreductase [Synechococcus sp. LTW-R]
MNSALAATCHSLSDTQVAALFDRWNEALATGDPAQVSALYQADALLLPTLSDQARTTTAGIEDYFKGFLSKHPTGRIDERVIQSDCNVAIDAGNYSFELDGQGWVQARYTFVYAYRDGEWRIEHHHSSLLP